MLEGVRTELGEVFPTVEAYGNDLDQYWPKIDRFDKLERLQNFRQPESRSWRACAAGRWEESLEQTERDRPIIAAEFAEDARLGYTSHRVRVVEQPITPYLQWEMHRFKVPRGVWRRNSHCWTGSSQTVRDSTSGSGADLHGFSGHV